MKNHDRILTDNNHIQGAIMSLVFDYSITLQLA
jgi:hypothetical protein